MSGGQAQRQDETEPTTARGPGRPAGGSSDHDAPAGSETPQPSPSLLAEDDAFAAGQLDKRTFLARLRERAMVAAYEELGPASVGIGCPFLELTLDRLRTLPAAEVVDRLHELAPAARSTRTAGELIAAVVDALREQVRRWRDTGRHTLPEQFVVQRRAGGALVTREAPTDVAARGVAGATSALPHRDVIQTSFGRHDVSQVRAAIGGTAAESAGELGASAFAIGDRVGFAAAPDLHTAAHEAAHVVQQRAGVQLRGGIDGGASDPHERHADQVADKVVRGESAEPLLDAYAGAGGMPAVQRKTETSWKTVNARRYLELNAFRTGEVIAQHLLQQRLPQPHPRLEWRNERLFYRKLLYGLSGILKFQSPYDVAQLLAPGDPYGTVDQLRPLTGTVEAPDASDAMKGGPLGPWTWSAPVGLAIAQLVEQALIDSLYRLGPRYLAIAEAVTSGQATVDADDIARSHPMDRFTVGPLCQPGVFAVIADGKPAPKSSPARRDPKPPLTLTWIGRENRELWNWVRASPADATVEEVSAALFEYKTTRDGEKRADYYAAFLTAAPPLFGLPPQWAKTFDETRAFRPAQIPGADTDPDHQIAVLGGSAQSDAQALAEIGIAAPDPKARSRPQPPHEHDNLVADATAQATALKGMLAGWRLAGAADRTLAFLARRRADGADAARWLPVLSAQRDNLTRISSGILQLDAAVDQMKLAKTGEQAAPLREIMRFYADATACAHLHQSCNRLLVRAAATQTSLTARGLGASLRDMDLAVDMMRSGVDASDHDRRRVSSIAMYAREQGTAMQTRMMRGGNVPTEQIEELQTLVEEAALDAKLTAVDHSLRQLKTAADEAGAGLAAWIASRFSGKFRGLHDATQRIQDRISDIRFAWDRAKHEAELPDDHGQVHESANLRKAVEKARQQFAVLAKEEDIQAFLREGASLVEWQQFRTACVQLAALIGISMVGSFVGGALARGVAGMMMRTGGAAVMKNLTLGGAIVARGAGLVAEAAIQSAGQSVIFGDRLDTAFLENMIMNLGSAAVLKALGSGVKEAARLEKATQSLWQKGAAAGKVVIKQTAVITGHAVMGAAMSYVAHKIVTGKEQPPPATLEEWLLQGAGIAVGRYVGRALEASRARQNQLELQGNEPGKRLASATEKLAALAKRVEARPQPDDAMELLVKRRQILTEELEILEGIARSPELLKQSGMNQQQLAGARAAIKHQLADVHAQGFGDVLLHLAGMKELIPGMLWSGTESQILDATRTAQESGISIKAKEDRRAGMWRVEINGRKVGIELRSDGDPRPEPRAGTRASETRQSDGESTKRIRPHASVDPVEAFHAGNLEQLPAELRVPIQEADAALAANDVHAAIKAFDKLGSVMEPAQRARLESAMAKARGVTDPAVYRNPTATLPDGTPVKPTAYNDTLHHGTHESPDVVFERGLHARGPNVSLLDHATSRGDSAFRGATEEVLTPDGRSAGGWAGDGGWVYMIDGIASWNINTLLQGRVRLADGSYSGNPMYGEREYTILANIPRERIVGAYPIHEVNGRLRRGAMISNPNYAPRRP